MPAYDYRCTACGVDEEIIHPASETEHEWLCVECDAPMRRRIAATPTIGAMPSKPVRLGGQDFQSNAEARRWQAQNPTARAVSQNDTWWRNHKDRARERAEGVAVRQGYRDLDQKRSRDIDAKKQGYTSDISKRNGAK